MKESSELLVALAVIVVVGSRSVLLLGFDLPSVLSAFRFTNVMILSFDLSSTSFLLPSFLPLKA